MSSNQIEGEELGREEGGSIVQVIGMHLYSCKGRGSGYPGKKTESSIENILGRKPQRKMSFSDN